MQKIAGIVCEFNPFHKGHEYLLSEVREKGFRTVCAMSGSFVQRGEPAVIDKFARAESAVRCGADLVIELPAPWACATAQIFAQGGVRLLSGTGVVDTLFFGSESADIDLIQRAAKLTGPDLDERLLGYLSAGMSYAAARQRAVSDLDPAAAAIMNDPNDILGIEYVRECEKTGLAFDCVRRMWTDHDGFASASWIRGHIDADLTPYMPAASLEILRRELDSGSAPVNQSSLDTALMAVLKRMKPEDFRKLPDVSEGLEYRLYSCARDAGTFSDFCLSAATRRYALSRIRRIGTAAFLGLEKGLCDIHPPYARILAFNDEGRKIIRDMTCPVITKTADCKDALMRKYLEIEALCDDLRSLGCPSTEMRRGGRGWRTSPVYVR